MSKMFKKIINREAVDRVASEMDGGREILDWWANGGALKNYISTVIQKEQVRSAIVRYVGYAYDGNQMSMVSFAEDLCVQVYNLSDRVFANIRFALHFPIEKIPVYMWGFFNSPNDANIHFAGIMVSPIKIFGFQTELEIEYKRNHLTNTNNLVRRNIIMASNLLSLGK